MYTKEPAKAHRNLPTSENVPKWVVKAKKNGAWERFARQLCKWVKSSPERARAAETIVGEQKAPARDEQSDIFVESSDIITTIKWLLEIKKDFVLLQNKLRSF